MSTKRQWQPPERLLDSGKPIDKQAQMAEMQRIKFNLISELDTMKSDQILMQLID